MLLKILRCLLVPAWIAPARTEDTKIVKSVSPAQGVTSYIFRGAGRTVTVLSPRPKHPADSLPAAGYDLFGNPLPKGAPLGKNLVYLISHE